MGDVKLEQIDQALSEVYEIIRADGGELEIVRIEHQTVYIRLKGACVSCPFAFYTVKQGVEQALQQQFGTAWHVSLIESEV